MFRDMISRRKRLLMGLVGAVGLVLSVPTVHAQTAPGVTKDRILLGGVLTLTGPGRLVTEPIEQGLRSYFKSINDRGGVHGRRIEWLVEDDSYQPARALAGVKKLVARDEVFMLVGVLGVPLTNAVSPFAEQAKVPLIAASASPQPPRRYTFGLMANYADVIYQLTNYLIKKEKAQQIGFLYQNDDLGEAGRAGLETALKEHGMKLAADVGFERGTTDFSTQVVRLKDAKVDVVVSMSIAPSTATAMKQASAIGFNTKWATFSVGNLNIMKKLLGKNIEGLFVGSELESQFAESPGMKEHREMLAKYYPNAKPDWGSLIGYAEARLTVGALKAAGKNLTREKIVEVLESTNSWTIGIMAPVAFGKTRRTGPSGVKIYQWRDGKPVAVSDWLPIGAGK